MALVMTSFYTDKEDKKEWKKKAKKAKLRISEWMRRRLNEAKE